MTFEGASSRELGPRQWRKHICYVDCGISPAQLKAFRENR